MTKFFVLTEYYKRLFEIIYQYLNSGENNTIKQLKNLLKLDLTQRDKNYLNIFCYIIKRREDPSKKITLEKDTLDFKNFPILNTLERFV